jgi:tRNA(Ile)-lysidine synthase
MLSPDQAIRHLVQSLHSSARLLVAVSGGSDSLGLLALLADALGSASADGPKLFAATIDHGLRAESAREAQAVAAFCQSRNIAHNIRRWEGEKPRTGLSAAARAARYRLLMEIADAVDATVILTGHTFDDQRETVAMRAARRDDEDSLGLAGMADQVLLQRRRWLLRPFLSTRRADIRLALEVLGLSWIDDPSNADPHYERVRMRQALASEAVSVAQEIGEAGRRRRRLSQEAAWLLHCHATLRQGVLAHITPAGLAEPEQTLRHALSAFAAVLGGRDHGPKTDSIERIMTFLGSDLPGRITAGRVIFDRRREGLYLQRENRGLPLVVVAPGQEIIWDGRFRLRNGTTGPVRVSPRVPDRSEAQRLFQDVPPSVAMRAMSMMPRMEAAGGDGTITDALYFTAVMAPFEDFLPEFDVELAREIGVLAGCDTFPLPPFQTSERKS